MPSITRPARLSSDIPGPAFGEAGDEPFADKAGRSVKRWTLGSMPDALLSGPARQAKQTLRMSRGALLKDEPGQVADALARGADPSTVQMNGWRAGNRTALRLALEQRRKLDLPVNPRLVELVARHGDPGHRTMLGDHGVGEDRLEAVRRPVTDGESDPPADLLVEAPR